MYRVLQHFNRKCIHRKPVRLHSSSYTPTSERWSSGQLRRQRKQLLYGDLRQACLYAFNMHTIQTNKYQNNDKLSCARKPDNDYCLVRSVFKENLSQRHTCQSLCWLLSGRPSPWPWMFGRCKLLAGIIGNFFAANCAPPPGFATGLCCAAPALVGVGLKSIGNGWPCSIHKLSEHLLRRHRKSQRKAIKMLWSRPLQKTNMKQHLFLWTFHLFITNIRRWYIMRESKQMKTNRGST